MPNDAYKHIVFNGNYKHFGTSITLQTIKQGYGKIYRRYHFIKKGDTFMLSEYLFYLCYNSFGSQSSLNTFFKDFPEENKVNFKKHKEIMLYLAEQYNKGYINLFGRKSLFDDIFMFFATLL